MDAEQCKKEKGMSVTHVHVTHTLFNGGELRVSQPVTLLEADGHVAELIEDARFSYGAENVQVVESDPRSGWWTFLVKDGEKAGRDLIAEIVVVTRCLCSAARRAAKPRNVQIVPEPATG